jgi:DNA-binding transcriptional ArsR family regulator
MEVATAIADPVRREILEMLRRGPMTAGAIAASFPISRPAVSRHLRVLREHGLVVDASHGRERVYRLDVTPLADLDAWLAQFRRGWAAALDALETEVRRTGRDRRAAEPTTAPTSAPTARPSIDTERTA